MLSTHSYTHYTSREKRDCKNENPLYTPQKAQLALKSPSSAQQQLKNIKFVEFLPHAAMSFLRRRGGKSAAMEFWLAKKLLKSFLWTDILWPTCHLFLCSGNKLHIFFPFAARRRDVSWLKMSPKGTISTLLRRGRGIFSKFTWGGGDKNVKIFSQQKNDMFDQISQKRLEKSLPKSHLFCHFSDSSPPSFLVL